MAWGWRRGGAAGGQREYLIDMEQEMYMGHRQRERENWNSKTIFYKDCGLGSAKSCSTTSLC